MATLLRPKKGHPILKIEILSSPLLFENLVVGSIPPAEGGEAQIMSGVPGQNQAKKTKTTCWLMQSTSSHMHTKL